MPRSGGPHGEAAKHDLVPVDGVLSADCINRLENVRFACPAISILHTAKRIKFNEVMFLNRRLVDCQETMTDTQCSTATRGGAAMKHNIETHGLCRIVFLRNNQAVGLARSVDRGYKAAKQSSLAHSPAGSARREFIRTRPAFFECTLNAFNIARGQHFFVTKEPKHIAPKCSGVGQQMRWNGISCGIPVSAKGLQSCLQFRSRLQQAVPVRFADACRPTRQSMGDAIFNHVRLQRGDHFRRCCSSKESSPRNQEPARPDLTDDAEANCHWFTLARKPCCMSSRIHACGYEMPRVRRRE